MITIIDYGLGNLASVANALAKLEIPFQISGDLTALKKAKALILPGVGAAGQGMKNLRTKNIDQIIIEQAKNGTPILGICLGMQLLFSKSEEGNVNCLDLVKGSVKKFVTSLKVPQIGWNQVSMTKDKLKITNDKRNLFKSIQDKSYFYFVNSYYCEPIEQRIVVGKTEYGKEFCSMLVQDNIVGVQFHLEKSGDVGLQLVKNFWEAIW